MTEATADQKHEEQQIIVTEDGYILDAETGEVVGHSDKQDWLPEDEAGVEWVLDKMGHHDAEIAALAARETAILENIRSMKKDHENRRKWLELRFGSAIKKIVKDALARAGDKIKTWKSPFGKVSFRDTKGACKINDMDAAVAWAENQNHDIVQVTKKVTATDVLGKIEEDEMRPSFLDTTPGEEKMTIHTGVGK